MNKNKLLKQLPKTPENLVIINQITRSATSMGANDREADGTTTKRGKRNRLLAKYNCRYKRILETKNEKSDTRRLRNN